MTNRELAKTLEVSPAAFSLIINQKPGVSDALRNRVVSELKRMGYGHLLKEVQPEKRDDNIGFVVYRKHGEILDLQPFFLLLMENIERRARQQDFNILFFTVDGCQPVLQQIQMLNERNVSGLLIFATEMGEEDMTYLRELDRPYVIMDNDFSCLPVNTVSIDNQMGTFQAVEYLVKMGHREIGYLQSSNEISSFQERAWGYRSALQKFQLELKPEYTFRVRYTEDGSYQDFSAILKEKPQLPTAFVTDDDTIAVGVLKALKEHGYRVPEDVSLIGYDDRPICCVCEPHLTTVDVSKYSFAAEAVDMLVGIIRNGENVRMELRPKKMRIATRLLARQSVERIR
ncbi:MAG: LacI family DNA-binding transcriptional regulator [Eubacteriales bacterium]|nr:LacI family DNA-binding transcriptional regulator [Eubacteriales bacterium]